MANVARVLVPTDFSVDSLRTVLDYLENHLDQRVEIVLACGYDIGDSITGILGFIKEDHLVKLENDDFIKGCEMIKSRFKRNIVELYADLLISKNVRYLRNYLKGNRITHLVLPKSFSFSCVERSAFNLDRVLREHADALSAKVVSVGVQIGHTQGIDTLDSMFFRKDWRMSYE